MNTQLRLLDPFFTNTPASFLRPALHEYSDLSARQTDSRIQNFIWFMRSMSTILISWIIQRIKSTNMISAQEKCLHYTFCFM